MIDSHLAADRAAWEAKPALREVYRDCYRRMAAALRPGRTLEVGGAIGNLKEFAETTGLDIISSDIQFAPWLDLVCDAHALPFAQGSLDNIVMFDVLHHLHRPRRFFAEAERALTIGGRIVLVEPAITPLSWPFYKFFHPEPVRLTDDPLAEGEPDPARHPDEANQAIPTLLFRRHARRFAKLFTGLTIKEVRLFSFFAYPLSGGFRPWSLIPERWARPLLSVEDAVAPVLGTLMGFRLFAVIERRGRD